MGKGHKKQKPIQSVAVLRSDSEAKCAFCNSNIDDEVKFGKIYTLGTITCHYYCVLLSSCLVQKGKDDEGLLGFLESDLIKEIARGKKLRCNYCGLNGATLACCTSVCKRQFHLPCGKARGTISLFYGNFQSFCLNHGPKQNLPEELQAKVKARIKLKTKRYKTVQKKIKCNSIQNAVVAAHDTNDLDTETSENQVCPICYEDVEAFPSVDTIWPPCCRGDRWFHRNCVERMALSAARHFLKCPLCNDKTTFCNSVMNQGVYVPDRDASWELEQGAYSELNNRKVFCNAKDCLCTRGRHHNVDNSCWEIILCASCGNVRQGCHIQCLDESSRKLNPPIFRCADCLAMDVAVPLETIVRALKIEADNVNSTSSNRNGRRVQRPVMPARMSLRRAMLSTHTARQGRSRESTFSGSSNSTENSVVSETGTFSKDIVNISSSSNDEVGDSIDIQSINEVMSEDEKYNCIKITPDIFSKIKPCPKSKKHKLIRKILSKEIEKMTSASSTAVQPQPTVEQAVKNDDTTGKNNDNQSICVITHTEGNYEPKQIRNEYVENSIERTEENIQDISISSNETIISDTKAEESCKKVGNISEKEKSCNFQCSYNHHHHTEKAEDNKTFFKSVIDFAIDAAFKFSLEKSKKEEIENNCVDKVKKKSDLDKLVESLKIMNHNPNTKIDNIVDISELDNLDDYNMNKHVDNAKSDKPLHKVINNSDNDNFKLDKVYNNDSDNHMDNSEVEGSDNPKNTSNLDNFVDNSKLYKHDNSKLHEPLDSVINNSEIVNLKLDKVDNDKSDNPMVDAQIKNSDNSKNTSDLDKHFDNSKFYNLNNSKLDKPLDNLVNKSEIDDLKLDEVDKYESHHRTINLEIKKSEKFKNTSASDERVDDCKLYYNKGTESDNPVVNLEVEKSDFSNNTSLLDKCGNNSKLDNYGDNINLSKNFDNSSPVFFISIGTENKQKHRLTVKTKIGNENIIDKVEISELNDLVKNTKLIKQFNKPKTVEVINKPKFVDSGSVPDKLIDIDRCFNNSSPILSTNSQSPNKIKHLLTVKTKIGKENVIDNVEVLCEMESSHNLARKRWGDKTSNNLLSSNSVENYNLSNIVDNSKCDNHISDSSPILLTKKIWKVKSLKNDAKLLESTNIIENSKSDKQSNKSSSILFTKNSAKISDNNTELLNVFENPKLEDPVDNSSPAPRENITQKICTNSETNENRRNSTEVLKMRKSPRLTSRKSSTNDSDASKSSKTYDSNKSFQDSNLEIFEFESKSESIIKSKRSRSDPVENLIKMSSNQRRNKLKANNRKNKRIKCDPATSDKEDIEKFKETNVRYVVFKNKTSEIVNKQFSPFDTSLESEKLRIVENSKNIDLIGNELTKSNEITVRKRNYVNLGSDQQNIKDIERNKLKKRSKEQNREETSCNNNLIKSNYFVGEINMRRESKIKVDSNSNHSSFEFKKKDRKINKNVQEINLVYLKLNEKSTKNESKINEPTFFVVEAHDNKTKQKKIDENLFFLESEIHDKDDEVIFTPDKLPQKELETKKNVSDNGSNSRKRKKIKNENKSKKYETSNTINISDDEVVLVANKLSGKSETKSCSSKNISSPSKNTNSNTNNEIQSFVKASESKLFSHSGSETEIYISGNSSYSSKSLDLNEEKTKKRKNVYKIDDSDEEIIFTPKKTKMFRNDIETINLDCCEEKNAKDVFSSLDYFIQRNKKDAYKLGIKNKHQKKNINKKNNSNKALLKSRRTEVEKNQSPNKMLIQTQLNLSSQNGFIKKLNSFVAKKKIIKKINKEDDSNMKQTTIGNFFTISP